MVAPPMMHKLCSKVQPGLVASKWPLATLVGKTGVKSLRVEYLSWPGQLNLVEVQHLTWGKDCGCYFVKIGRVVHWILITSYNFHTED